MGLLNQCAMLLEGKNRGGEGTEMVTTAYFSVAGNYKCAKKKKKTKPHDILKTPNIRRPVSNNRNPKQPPYSVRDTIGPEQRIPNCQVKRQYIPKFHKR